MSRPDIYTVRPPDEPLDVSIQTIKDELAHAGLVAVKIEEGHTQPDGSTLFYAYLEA